MSEKSTVPYHPTSLKQANHYAANEILWSNIYYAAWEDEHLMKRLHAAAEKVKDGHKQAVNKLLVELADERNWPQPVFPEGLHTQIVFDKPKLVHLRLPAFENMPSSPVAMVPYNI